MNYASKVIEIAEAEVGYLEKKSNSQLDDKTAGSDSITTRSGHGIKLSVELYRVICTASLTLQEEQTKQTHTLSQLKG